MAYNLLTAEGEEFGEFQGIDPEGNLLWTYVTPSYSMAQLSRITPIGLYQDRYYLIEDGTVVALDLLTGNVLFENPDFRGSPAPEAMLIDDFGYLYLSGYDSPLLFIMDPEGHTVRRITDYDTDYCMPFRLTMEGDTLTIHMESDGRGGSGDFPLEITADWLPQAVG